MKVNVVKTVAGVAGLGLLLAACGGGGGDGDGITIGIKFDQPGLGLKVGEEYSGFDVDVARYVAAELGYEEGDITWTETPSASREDMLEGGQVDMIFATYSITDERKERVDFAGPYFVAGQDILVLADNTDITGPEDLDGKTLCSVTGSTPAQRIKDEYAEGVQLQEFGTYSECIDSLVSNALDAVTTDDIILAGFAGQESYEGQLKVVGAPFSEELYGVGLQKGSDLCSGVNDAITKMIDEGAWDEAVAANVTESYTPSGDNPPSPGGHC